MKEFPEKFMKNQNQMNNKSSTYKTNTETSIFIPWEPLVWKWVGLKYP
jgi:hypothetical protein